MTKQDFRRLVRERLRVANPSVVLGDVIAALDDELVALGTRVPASDEESWTAVLGAFEEVARRVESLEERIRFG